MKKVGLLGLALLLVAIFGFLIRQIKPVSIEQKAETGVEAPEVPYAEEGVEDQIARDIPDPNDSRLLRHPNGTVSFLPSVEVSRTLSTSADPRNDLDLLDQVFSFYRFAFKENPVGVENFEFTQSLRGKNPKSVIFVADDSPALKGNELVDRWGTPYFFHPISRDQIEITSAGPDKTLWTNDDIELKFD